MHIFSLFFTFSQFQRSFPSCFSVHIFFFSSPFSLNHNNFIIPNIIIILFHFTLLFFPSVTSYNAKLSEHSVSSESVIEISPLTAFFILSSVLFSFSVDLIIPPIIQTLCFSSHNLFHYTFLFEFFLYSLFRLFVLFVNLYLLHNPSFLASHIFIFSRHAFKIVQKIESKAYLTVFSSQTQFSSQNKTTNCTSTLSCRRHYPPISYFQRSLFVHDICPLAPTSP